MWSPVLLLVAAVAAFSVPPRDYDHRDYFVVEIDTSGSLGNLSSFISAHNESYRFEHPARGFDDHFVFSVAKDHPLAPHLGNYNSNEYSLLKRSDENGAHYDQLVSHPGLKSIHMLPAKRLERRLPISFEPAEDAKRPKKRLEIVDSAQKPAKEVSDKLQIEDPIFLEQWHLVNTQYPGNDVNVKQVWYDGIRGRDVTVAIIDDGLDYESPDLKDNFNADGSWDFNDNTALPKPRLFDDYHGTRCAGEVAAVKNDVCGLGVAYEAKVAGIRILSGSITTEEEAAAMVYGLEHNDIYSCSWGPTDDGRTMAAPDKLVKKAMIKGIQEGRQNKGSLYVFASGNGGRVGDQCNFDGYTNSIYSITVGAIDYQGNHPSYAETCSAVMVVTYSSGSNEHIHTTDIHNKCSSTHGGTSAAAPLAAGIYALVFQANPELTWRDVQYVTAMAAVPVNEEDGDYQMTALGQKYSHKYGFGNIDAELLVDQAKKWKNVKPQAWHYSDNIDVDRRAHSDNNEDSPTISSTVTIDKAQLEVMNLERIEHVNVIVNIEASSRGKVDIKLTSPGGVVSRLAWFRPMDNSGSGFPNWTFMSVAHWGEDGVGDWKLEVFTGGHQNVHFKNWRLNFFGESIDADKAEKFDIDEDYAKVRRERMEKLPAQPSAAESKAESQTEATDDTETAAPETSSEAVTSSTVVASATSSQASATSGHASATPTGEEEDGAKKHYSADHYGQYFMILTVFGFIFVVAMMKWHKNQSSSRRRRGDFEFDIIPGEDYSDSEDDRESYELESRSDADLERDRLFEEFDPDALIVSENDDMFKIGDEDEEAHESDVKDEPSKSN